MITSRFPLGNVSFTIGYFSTLVGEATKQCYGVAAMAPRDMTDAVQSMVHGSDYPEKGVRVHAAEWASGHRAAHCRQLRSEHFYRRTQHLPPRQGRGRTGHRTEGRPRGGVRG